MQNIISLKGRWHYVTEWATDPFGNRYAKAHHDIDDDIAGVLKLQSRDQTLAVGTTPEECIKALAKEMDWGEPRDFRELAGGDSKYTWGRRFVAGESGTGFKAAGWGVPGGFVLTWWK